VTIFTALAKKEIIKANTSARHVRCMSRLPESRPLSGILEQRDIPQLLPTRSVTSERHPFESCGADKFQNATNETSSC
jgi:hypothetical protein